MAYETVRKLQIITSLADFVDVRPSIGVVISSLPFSSAIAVIVVERETKVTNFRTNQSAAICSRSTFSQTCDHIVFQHIPQHFFQPLAQNSIKLILDLI